MKKFISANWYKIMMGTSLLITSIAFLVYSVSSAIAKDPKGEYPKYISPEGSATIFVRLADDQLEKIIPRNEDGSINIRLGEEQMKALAPPNMQKVDIQLIRGVMVGVGEAKEGLDATHVLGTCSSKDVQLAH